MTTTQPSIVREESLCCACYLTVLNLQKATDDVEARTRMLQDKVASARAFFSSSKHVSGLLNPLLPSPHQLLNLQAESDPRPMVGTG